MKTAPTKILLIGQNDTLVNNVKKIIPPTFAVSRVHPSVEEVSDEIEAYRPDIAILCLDLDVEMDVDAYAEMSSLGMFDDMAVIVLGQVEECRIFENKVFIRGVHMMQRPFKGSTLAIMLNTCETELSADHGEHPPTEKRFHISGGEPHSYREAYRESGEMSYEGDYRRERAGRYADEAYERIIQRVEDEREEMPLRDSATYTVVSRKKKAEKRNSALKLHHDDVLLIPPEHGRYFRNIVKEKQIRREIVRPDDDDEEKTEEHVPKMPTHVSGKFSILVIDDDVQLLGAVRKYLQNDYFVTTVPSGKMAYKFVDVNVVDVILLDYLMRDEDGPSVFRALRNNPKTKETPIIFLTGVSDKERVMNVLSLNPQGYLLKPIQKQELMEAIEKVLE